jgi:hypothetical protein
VAPLSPAIVRKIVHIAWEPPTNPALHHAISRVPQSPRSASGKLAPRSENLAPPWPLLASSGDTAQRQVARRKGGRILRSGRPIPRTKLAGTALALLNPTTTAHFVNELLTSCHVWDSCPAAPRTSRVKWSCRSWCTQSANSLVAKAIALSQFSASCSKQVVVMSNLTSTCLHGRSECNSRAPISRRQWRDRSDRSSSANVTCHQFGH